MEPAPRPALEMIQPQLLLHLLIALLHRPAALPEPHRTQPTRPHRQVREGELDLAVGLLLNQQPQWLGAGTPASFPTLRRPDPHPAKLPRQFPFGPFPPGHFPPRQAPRQLLQTNRSRVPLSQVGVRWPPASGRGLRPLPARL